MHLPRIVAIVFVLIASGLVVFGLLMPRGASTQPALIGSSTGDAPAPDFTLHDQFNRSVRLDQFRGQPVVVTFLGSQCTTQCPIIAETLRRTMSELGAAGARVALLAVSTAPELDTVASVRRFSQKHGLLHRWHFLRGSRQELTSVWKAYYVFAAPRGALASVRDAHTAATYLIDSDGHRRIVMGGVPRSPDLVHDLRIMLGLPSDNPNHTIPAPEVGHPAPNFTIAGVDGGKVSLHSLRGKVVLVNFWATWCAPCRSEIPRLSRWYRRYQRRGLVIVGIDQQESRGDVAGFVKPLRVSYPLALDTNGDVSAHYSIGGLPASFVVDRDGMVETVNPGIIDDSFLRTHLLPLLTAS